LKLRAKQIPNALEDKSIEMIMINHIRQAVAFFASEQQITVLINPKQESRHVE
jgi:hypothetical protein